MTTDSRPRACGFVPYPGNGAYGHWECQLKRWHLGPHRFINYTIPRAPQVWHLRQLWRNFRLARREGRASYRSTLFRATYRPTDV